MNKEKQQKEQEAINFLIKLCEKRIKESGVKNGYYAKIIQILKK